MKLTDKQIADAAYKPSMDLTIVECVEIIAHCGSKVGYDPGLTATLSIAELKAWRNASYQLSSLVLEVYLKLDRAGK